MAYTDADGNVIPGSEEPPNTPNIPPTTPTAPGRRPTPYPDDAWKAQLKAWYREYLGRDPDPPDYATHWNNPDGDAGVLAVIKNSPEAKKYAESRAPGGGGGGTTPTTALSGWDQAKWSDPNKKSIKYVAGRVFAQFKPSDYLTNQASVLAALKAAGLNPTAIGKDKIDFGDGYGPIDVLLGAEKGGQGWAWQPVKAISVDADLSSPTGTGGGSGASGGANSMSLSDLASYGSGAGRFGSLNSEFGETFTPEPWKGTGATDGSGFDWTVPDIPDYVPPPDFKAPTEADMQQDPSYRVRYDEGLKAAQAAKATQGILRTGGTLKALTRYGQDQASKEYAAIYDRALGTYGVNTDKNLNAYTTNLSKNAGVWDRRLQASESKDAIRYRDWQADQNSRKSAFQDRYKIWNDQQNRIFDQYYKLSSLGASTAMSS